MHHIAKYKMKMTILSADFELISLSRLLSLLFGRLPVIHRLVYARDFTIPKELLQT